MMRIHAYDSVIIMFWVVCAYPFHSCFPHSRPDTRIHIRLPPQRTWLRSGTAHCRTPAGLSQYIVLTGTHTRLKC